MTFSSTPPLLHRSTSCFAPAMRAFSKLTQLSVPGNSLYAKGQLLSKNTCLTPCSLQIQYVVLVSSLGAKPAAQECGNRPYSQKVTSFIYFFFTWVQHRLRNSSVVLNGFQSCLKLYCGLLGTVLVSLLVFWKKKWSWAGNGISFSHHLWNLPNLSKTSAFQMGGEISKKCKKPLF